MYASTGALNAFTFHMKTAAFESIFVLQSPARPMHSFAVTAGIKAVSFGSCRMLLNGSQSCSNRTPCRTPCWLTTPPAHLPAQLLLQLLLKPPHSQMASSHLPLNIQTHHVSGKHACMPRLHSLWSCWKMPTAQLV